MAPIVSKKNTVGFPPLNDDEEVFRLFQDLFGKHKSTLAGRFWSGCVTCDRLAVTTDDCPGGKSNPSGYINHFAPIVCGRCSRMEKERAPNLVLSDSMVQLSEPFAHVMAYCGDQETLTWSNRVFHRASIFQNHGHQLVIKGVRVTEGENTASSIELTPHVELSFL
jgi:hypothetical protein